MKVLQIHERDLGPSKDCDLDPQQAVCSSRGGGLAVYLAQMINGLRQRGEQVSVVEFDPGCRLPVDLGHRYHRLKAFRFRFARSTVSAFWRIVEKENPDLVHLHSVYHELNPLLLRRLARRRPVIWTLHDVKPLCFWGTKLHPDNRLCGRPVGLGCLTCGCYRIGAKNPVAKDLIRVLGNPFYQRMYRRLPAMIVPSGYLKTVLVTNGFREDRIQVMPLFSRFGGCDDSLPTEPSIVKILFVGRLDHKKGVQELIAALSFLSGKKWEAVVAGDGVLLDAARAQAAECGLDGRVTFVPPPSVEALKEHYRSCSFVVFPSLIAEAFGLVGVEAMSFGKPVVAFEAGGVTQWLEDGVNGLLARHGDVRHLAQQVDRLIDDGRLLAALGLNARRQIRERFTLDHHLDRLTKAYRDVADAFGKAHDRL